MEIAIKKLNEKAQIPTRGSDYAAGYDLYADLGGEGNIIHIPPHKTIKINTGIAMAIPTHCFGAIFARSGLATKNGLRPSNCVGVIDSDYRGEIIVALHNDMEIDQIVGHGSRIAQLVIMPFVQAQFYTVSELDETERGAGGFGSTDRKD